MCSPSMKAKRLCWIGILQVIILVRGQAPYRGLRTVSQPRGRSRDSHRNAWIIELNSATPSAAYISQQLPRALGGRVGTVFKRAINGFVYYGTDVEKFAKDPMVKSITRDGVVTVATTRVVPTGIKRIFAHKKDYMEQARQNCRCDAVVAVLDTGVDYLHPDLNVNLGMSADCTMLDSNYACMVGVSPAVLGHGTHVAGTIAAIKNQQGVVGVCPGAEIWSIKVIADYGIGYDSWILAGLEYVLKNSAQADVVNMSLQGDGCNPFTCKAITRLKKAGVAVAVSAGNRNSTASAFTPACCPGALTVSALADSDGNPGGKGPPTCFGNSDDRIADYSNYGSAVNIAAPGDCIFSTFPENQYLLDSGTSMAAPHVAGALAVLASRNHSALVKDHYRTLIKHGNYNYQGKDPSRKEPLLDMRKLPDAHMVGKRCDCGD